MKALRTILIILIIILIAAAVLYFTGVLKKEVETSININAPREQVFAALTEFGEYEAWNSPLRFDELPGAVGQKFTFHYVDAGGNAGMKINPELLALEAPQLIKWKGSIAGPIIFSGEHQIALADNGDGTTTLTHSEIFDGVLVPFYGGAIRDSEKNFILFNQQLKTYVENQAMPTEPETIPVTQPEILPIPEVPEDTLVTNPPS